MDGDDRRSLVLVRELVLIKCINASARMLFVQEKAAAVKKPPLSIGGTNVRPSPA